MFIERKIHQSIKKHLAQKQISVITGMRRTGKTTLIKKLLDEIASDNKLYIDLQRLDNRDLFLEKNYENVLRALTEKGLDFSKRAYLALDELQLVPEAVSVLKYLYDHYKIKFLVTGSSSFYLKNLFSESLSGRKKIFELYPLDFGEFLFFKHVKYAESDFLKNDFLGSQYERLKRYYEEFIKFGGFPEVVLAKNITQKKDLLVDILSSYINIDIKALADLKNDRDFYNLIKLLAGRIGAKLDLAKLSRLSGIARPTVQNYLNLLEKSYLIKRVSVFTKSPDREIVKAQKLYFCDNGLANLLYDLDGGFQFENAIFNQLSQKGEIRYYGLKSGREIDFILNGKVAFEVKESPTDFDLKNLRGIAKIAGIQTVRLIGRYPTPKFKNYTWGGDIK
ncbi:ATP-binding protein [Candidatus Parcubacteria bacterium]|nr:ATP-binding protein [Candidatus Parcubacteria bacterium]